MVQSVPGVQLFVFFHSSGLTDGWLGVTKPPSPTGQPYANILLVQKRWNNEIFYGEFQCEIRKTNSAIFARDSCLNIIFRSFGVIE